MLELITIAAAGAASAAGYFQSKRFVRDRLRFVDAVQGPMVPIAAGVAAAAVAAPVVALLPLVGAGTALLFGVGVGAGVRSGVRAIRRALPGE